MDQRLIGFIKCRIIEAHGPGQLSEYLAVGQGPARRVGRFHLRRDRQVEIGENEIITFKEARRRQDDIGIGRGVGVEEIDGDMEEIVAFERTAQPALLGRRGSRIVVPVEKSARFAAVFERGRQIHMADRAGAVARERRLGHHGHVDATCAGAVQIAEARALLAEIAGEGDKRRERPEDVAAHGLALHALAEPEEGRSLAIGDRGRLDQCLRHATELGRA